MNNGHKAIYIVLGGLLSLVLVFGAVITFAQTGGDSTDVTPPGTTPGEGDTGALQMVPGWRRNGQGGFRNPGRGRTAGDAEYLAEALGISVEELRAAWEEALTAAIEQAVIDGRVTQDQADQFLSGTPGFRARFGPLFLNKEDGAPFLAAALNISPEQLQEAVAEAKTARLADLVEAGVLSQEQVDLMTARQAIRSYIDIEALQETLRDAYETAVDQALSDGAITQEQADKLLENYPGVGLFGGRPGFRGRPGRGAPFQWDQPPANALPSAESAAGI